MKKDRLSDHRPWHTFSPEATCGALTSTEQGLSQKDAGRRITQYGLNKLTPAASRGPIKRFFSQFHNVLHDLSGHAFVFIKGAPERVLAMCSLQRIDGQDIPLHAAPWQQMMDRELKAAIRNSDVFARTSPENKLRLVTALQADGQVVAMTGDGVNDAPALKRADAGVAMGKKGTEVAKEISEMVLADDNFASIADAVEEGRGIYDNLKKAIIFILPTGVGEALTIVAAIVMGEIFYVFNSRYLYHSVLNLHGLFGNRLVWLAIITLIAFQMALTYWHPMQVLFGTVAIDAHTWKMIVAVASSVFILVEIEKFFIRLFMPKAAVGKSRNTL